MGSGIAQVAAAAGFRTIVYDLREDIILNAGNKMEKDLQMLVDKQKISVGKKKEISDLILFTTDIEACRADLVIEAVVEKAEVKTILFRELARVNGPETIFTSNTSSLSISNLQKDIPGPERFAGLHFFNPAPVMKLVEVVKGELTSNHVVKSLCDLTLKMDKQPVVCKDSPGFIVNRVARPYYIESLRLAEQGVASFENIDRLLEARGFRMGPFRLMDLIGNDVNYAVSCSVYEQLSKPERLKPSPIQKEKVEKGELGKKSGKGYYNYQLKG